IYAEQLISLGYGYPLWVPDPAPGQAPIQIGDVGWVHEGEFHVLFNALREAHVAQPMDAVPANFAPLNPKGLQIWGPREKIWQRVLCSRTIHRREISGGAMVNGVDFNFRCSGDSGAFLMVNPRAMTHDILSERAVANYMNANFDSWLSFANDTVGLNIREDDIRFVTGTTTTAQWAVAAFRSSCRNKQGTLTCSLAGTGTASFSMSISDEALPTSHYRVGPPKLQPTHPSPHTTRPAGMPSESILPHSPEEMTYDQCIFVHTLKRKKR
ncbi:uncharacterized protein TRAVEDRAFT_77124, partial [Trametes versicolor FP-101664 SS1]|uniref:uncharacterized protein n=1 Tax=Trametes versicolor (strain FP-101664) TaxID=717944 RepID=UPI000462180A